MHKEMKTHMHNIKYKYSSQLGFYKKAVFIIFKILKFDYKRKDTSSQYAMTQLVKPINE